MKRHVREPAALCRAVKYLHSAVCSASVPKQGSCMMQVVDFQGWQSIDTAEVAAGQHASKPREKFVKTQDMIRLGAGM